MQRDARWLLGFGFAVVLATDWPARSQNILESLVMPGPLIEGHAKLEKECRKCHEPFARASQTGLCLACHKDIAADRRLAKSFHGRHPDVAKQDCRHCHTEHKGRGADIVQLDRETFNHAFANFDLKGAHKTARCDGCHGPTVKFRKAPGRCFDCHKASDPHKGGLGEGCNGCHSEEAWRRVRPFDHTKTRFPLEGSHKTVACSACHAGEVYKDLATGCVTCHRVQDAHGGRYGAKCETCHDLTKWKSVRFNHDKGTKYPLRGGHTKVKCDACHTGDLYRDKLATTCVSCHKKDDPHKGQLGGRCERCHGEAGWRQKVSFDHDLARFPLIGRHAVVPCEECHRSSSFKDAPRLCANCHRDRHHEGRLGADCSVCHNPNGWARWRFDHGTQARYPLTGAHQGLQCHGCHTTKNVSKVALSTDCYNCHRADDIHQGAFGRSCDRCHGTTSFTQNNIRR